MIVIAGIPSEPPIELAVEAAQEAGVEHVVVSQRESARLDVRLSVGPDGVHGSLTVGGRRVDLDELDGIYWRLMEPGRLPEAGERAAPEQRARVHRVHEVLTTVIDTAPCRVANRITAMASNSSKPYQARLVQRVGFPTPPTLVTNEPDAVARAERDWGPLVFKSVSSVRSIVRPLDDAARARLDQVRWLPTQFQRAVPGVDVRVHVVGSAVFATEVRTDAVDYRYAGRDGLDADLVACDLPPEIAQRCRDLARHLDLPFCGIDLRRGPEGQWWCFEVNPSPGYSYYQSHTGQPISAALVRWLAGEDADAKEGSSPW